MKPNLVLINAGTYVDLMWSFESLESNTALVTTATLPNKLIHRGLEGA
jgi:hypothetical protein